MQYLRNVSLTGSLSVSKMDSPNSARYRLACSGEKSRRHSLAEGLPVSEATEFVHEPVLVDAIVALFAEVPSGYVVDATLGGAGHARRILDNSPHLRIIGIDRDASAVAVATERLKPYGDRAIIRQARFEQIDEVITSLGIDEISGALFDLGVSSPQLDRGERGFSYRVEAPLDMRMDQSQTLTADDVVNTYERGEIIRILRDYADERFASRIADAIIAARPIHTTERLAQIVTTAIPAATRRTGGHPAKRTFQAIRIEVNAELDQLPRALESAIRRTRPFGRVAVISYHSGEDRIAKHILREAETGGCTCRADLPCGCGAKRLVKRVRCKETPTEAEQKENPRARSARLRVVERLSLETAVN